MTQISRFLFKKLSFCSSYVLGTFLYKKSRTCTQVNSFNQISNLEHFRKWTVNRGYYRVARRHEFYFRVAKQYFTNERSEWVKYRFCNEKIKSVISSSRRVMFFLLYTQKDIDKIIDFYSPKSNCDGSDLQYSNTRHHGYNNLEK